MTAQSVGKDKVVSLTYTLRNQNGEVFEQCEIPVSYMHGRDSGLFDKVERALEGRKPGDTLDVTLTPEEGFGSHDPGLTLTDDIDNVPAELRYVGANLEAQNSKGEILNFVVTQIENGKMTVDANHALAGQTVTFHVTVLEVRDATPDELRSGRLDGKIALH